MSARMNRLERFARWSRYFASASADPATLYDLLGEGAIQSGGEVPVVNMGLWSGIAVDEPRAIERAVFALFDRVATGAQIGPGMHVLDAGCGFGTNALRLVARHGAGTVIGLNVSAAQLDTAARIARSESRSADVTWLLGDATRMPLPAECVDRVTSVEAAFHFDTRDAFFAEAMRVLRPGGLLSLVDLVAPPPRNGVQRVALASIRRTQAVPRANVYDRDEYVRRVEAAGFVVVEAESIAHQVVAPFRRWQLSRPPSMLVAYDWFYSMASAPYLFYPWDYLRLVARRPARA